jgi:hypothetical protein
VDHYRASGNSASYSSSARDAAIREVVDAFVEQLLSVPRRASCSTSATLRGSGCLGRDKDSAAYEGDKSRKAHSSSRKLPIASALKKVIRNFARHAV